MDITMVYMFVGFLLASYSVIANDSVQTLGTFISSNHHIRWQYLWLGASTVLIMTLTYGWYVNGGDISYGRLNKIPPIDIQWYHALAPAVLVFLTRYGIPVSTTFLVLSVFASTVVLEEMLIKSVKGYMLAAVVAYALWYIITSLDQETPIKESHKPWWRTFQWFSTGFLWCMWLSHDMANIAVYLPRQLPLEMLTLVIIVLVGGLAYIFSHQGGKIQKIVLEKSGTRYVRSATMIDLVYGFILLYFKQYNDIPMSTTWVFVGLLAGRECALATVHDYKKFKVIFPLITKDFFKMMVGLAVSVTLVLVIHHGLT